MRLSKIWAQQIRSRKLLPFRSKWSFHFPILLQTDIQSTQSLIEIPLVFGSPLYLFSVIVCVPYFLLAFPHSLQMHRFAAFMAHMPALNVLLDGLQRRRPAGVSALCDILEGRAPAGIVAGSRPPLNPPVVAELSLICPVFRTRMRVPGRITGCEHIEAFDMEAFLRREVLWPRLNCPICG